MNETANFNAVSANTLFHFTPSLDNLLSILKNNFYPRYYPEDYSIFKDGMTIAFPMVCFCDLPFSQIRKHIKIYGSYGLGLSKDWGIRKGMNPLLYLSKDSPLYKEYLTAIPGLFNERWSDPDALKISTFIKRIRGDFYSKNLMTTLKNYNFTDEREWRFIPSDLDKRLSFYSSPSESELKSSNTALEKSKYRLEFEPSDIRYLILNKEDEIYEFLAKLDEIKEKYDFKTKRVLSSKILTVERIQEDF